MNASEDLALYDLTRQRLRDALVNQLCAASRADIESTLTAYAYWVCAAVRKRGADWETALREYIGYAVRDAERETESEQRECALLRRALRAVPEHALLLDVGAGWGRLAPLYAELNLRAVFIEPVNLGVQLMRRHRLDRIVRAVGEALPFPSSTFSAALLGWVLHHDSPDLDAAAIVGQVARVLTADGWLFSIEPLGTDFTLDKWTGMLAQCGIVLDDAQEFFQMPTPRGEIERYTLVIGRKLHNGLEKGAKVNRAKDQLEGVIAFHGHHCPGVTIGYRAALIALRELNVARAQDEELVAICENDACGVDAVQYLTGCTIGKGNLILRDWGKQVFTFGRRNDGKMLRIALKYGTMPNVPDLPPEERRKLAFERLEKSSDAELFDVRWIDAPLPDKARIFKSVLCAQCGEGVSEARARVREGAFVCPACYGEVDTGGW